MMEIDFRDASPVRTCEKVYACYRSYKKYLKEDFNSRCGYCDGRDKFNGGFKVYHIDHFAPQKKFPDLECSYSNLIYSCPSCNLAKGDHWVSDSSEQSVLDEEGFVDPCDSLYEELFARNENGEVYPKNKLGEYIHRKLRLGLKRHSVVWTLDRLDKIIAQVELLLAEEEKEDLSSGLLNLYRSYKHYMDYMME